MEPWQRKHITKHLPELLENITINEQLKARFLAEDVLHHTDLEQVDTINKNTGNQAAVKKLLDMLMSRKNSYIALGIAAYKTKQSKTFLILLRGLVQHLLPQCSIELDNATLERILSTDIYKEETLTFYMNQLDKTNRSDDNWLPQQRGPFYIPRQISNRVKLSTAVFKQDCIDIFVFTGLTRSELTKLAKPNRTAASGQVILGKWFNERFIFLEQQQDWKQLTTTIAESIKILPQADNIIGPIHLIAYDKSSREYILQESTHRSQVVSKNVPPHLREKSLYIPEQQFLNDVVHQEQIKSICICDTPGMGKTWLLENLARCIKQINPNRIVSVIELSKFAQHAYKTANENSILDFDRGFKLLLSFLFPSNLMSAIFATILKSEKVRLELFLDGFDEISKKHLKMTKEFFKTLDQQRKNIRIFVTSRPHMRKQLEKTFNAISCDILPFSEEIQVEYLIKHWQNSETQPYNLPTEKLEIFAKACLRMLKKSLTKEEGDLMGIPLQCFLLASVNHKNAQLYCSRGNDANVDEFVSVTSMFDMYSRYFEMGFKRATNIHEENNDDVKTKKAKQDSLKSFHVWKALELLHPDLAEDYSKNENLVEQQVSEQIFACGILKYSLSNDGGNTTVAFLHRTFAEFLVAELFSYIVTGCYCFTNNEETQNKFLGIFVKDILRVEKDSSIQLRNSLGLIRIPLRIFSFVQAVTTCFLNSFLERFDTRCVLRSTSGYIFSHIKKGEFAPLLSAANISCQINLIRIFKCFICKYTQSIPENIRLLSFKTNITCSNTFSEDPYNMLCYSYLCLATNFSNVKVLEILYSLFSDCLDKQLDDITKMLPEEVETPLHIALRRREYEIVEYFIDRISLPHRSLFYYFLEYTKECTQSEIHKAIEICNLLIENYSLIIYEKSSVKLKKPHMDLIKLWIGKLVDGAEFLNVLTFVGVKLNDTKFCDLCRYLIHDEKFVNFFLPKLNMWDDPMPYIVGRVDEDIIKFIFLMELIDPNHMDENRNNWILICIKNGGNVGAIRALTESGIHPFNRNDKGQVALHVSAETGNVEITKHLVSTGLSLDDKDNNGNIPLHYTKDSLSVLKYLVTQNNIILSVNNDGNNIAHLAAHARNHEVVNYLVTLKEAPQLFSQENVSMKTPLHILLAQQLPNKYDIDRVLSLEGLKIVNDRNEGNHFLVSIECNQSVTILQLLKEKGADPFYVTNSGKSLLHLVVEQKNLQVLEYLVLLGIPLEHKDEQGNTPFHDAHQNLDILKYLLSQTVDILASNNDGDNIAHLSARAGNIEVVDYLVTLKEVPALFGQQNYSCETPLHLLLAKKSLQTSLVKTIFNLPGVDVSTNTKEGNIIHYAIIGNQSVKILQLLKSIGVDPFYVHSSGKAAIHIAAQRGNMEVIVYLVSLGFLLDLKDEQGNTPLHCAKDHVEVVKYLVANHVDIFARNNDGDNIAHLAANSNNQLDLVAYLVTLEHAQTLFSQQNYSGKAALNLNLANFCLSNALFNSILALPAIEIATENPISLFLHATTEYPGLNTLQRLTQTRLDPFDVNSSGETAVHIATYQKDVEYLLSLGLPLEHKDIKGNTPLLCGNKILDSVKYLVSQNVDILAVNNDGDNIAHLAATTDYSIVCYLLTLKEAPTLFSHINNSGITPMHLMLANWYFTGKKKAMFLHSFPESEVLSEKKEANLFLHGIKYGLGEEFFKLLKTNEPNPFRIKLSEKTVLHLAAKMGNLKAIKYFVSLGFSLEQRDEHENTPLHYAYQYVDVLKYLVSQNVNIHAVNHKGDNIVHLAAKGGQEYDTTPCIKYDLRLPPNSYEVVDYLATLNVAQPLFYQKNKSGEMSLHGLLAKGFPYNLIRQLLHTMDFPNVEGLTNNDDKNLFNHAIIGKQNVKMLQFLKDRGVNPFCIDSSGKSAIHHATEQANLEVIKYLVSTGHQLEQRDKHGNTPLHYAKNNLDVVKYLISRNIDVCAVNNEGENIAHLAGSSWEGRHVVNYLVSLKEARKLFCHQNISGKKPLHLILAHGFLLLDKLECVLGFSEIDMVYETEDENLFFLAIKGKQNIGILKFLKEKGSNPFHVNSTGKTAIHLSVELGYLEAIKYLVSLGLSLEHRDYKLNPILLYAQNKLQVVKYLISQNVDILAVNKDGNNIAHQAARSYRSYGVINYLVTLKFAPLLFTWSNNSGKTPLHLLLAGGVSHKTSIKLVLNIPGLELSRESKENLFLYAIEGGQDVTILQLLRDKGADPYSVDSSGKTALHLAAMHSKLAIIEYLLSIGLALEDKDETGNTPLMLSILNWDITNLLISKGANVLAADNNGSNIAHLLVQEIFVKSHKFGNREFHRYLRFVPHGAELLQMTNKWKRTPLHDYIASTAQPPSCEVFKQLLEMAKVNINQSDFEGNTFFLTAVQRNGCFPFLKILMECGTNHKVTNIFGDNALHLAFSAFVSNGLEVEVVEFLISLGCDQNHVNNKGETPYQRAYSLSRQNLKFRRRFSYLCTILLQDNPSHSQA